MTASIRNNDLKHYFQEIKILLPLNGESKKRFVSDLEINMRDYVRDNPSCNIEELYDEFGTPSDVVINYFETIDTNRLIKRIRLAKWIRTSLIVLLIIAFIFSVFRGVLLYKDYKAAQEENVTIIEETIINE